MREHINNRDGTGTSVTLALAGVSFNPGGQKTIYDTVSANGSGRVSVVSTTDVFDIGPPPTRVFQIGDEFDINSVEKLTVDFNLRLKIE